MKNKFVKMQLNKYDLCVLDHALRMYTSRANAIERDLIGEKQLLQRVNDHISVVNMLERDGNSGNKQTRLSSRNERSSRKYGRDGMHR